MKNERKRAELRADEYYPSTAFKSFYKLPREIASVPAKNMSEGAKLLFGVLAGMAGYYGTAYPKVETLCAVMGGRNRRTIQRWTRELVGLGLISSRFKGKRLPNNYYFLRSGIIGNGTPEQNHEWEEYRASVKFSWETEVEARKEKRSEYERGRKAKKQAEVLKEAEWYGKLQAKQELQAQQMREAEARWEAGASDRNGASA